MLGKPINDKIVLCTSVKVSESLMLCVRLRLFQNFESFRVLVCGGDGSVGWVLTEIDKLDLHKQVLFLLPQQLSAFSHLLTVVNHWHQFVSSAELWQLSRHFD